MDSSNPTAGDGGHLTTTTVRFDADTWSEIQQHARRLGVAKAAFIRDAARAEIARLAEREHVARGMFGHDLDELYARVGRIEHAIGGRAA